MGNITLDQVYKITINLIRFCTWFTRWLASSFLSIALWVIFDQEGNIMVVAHRMHYMAVTVENLYYFVLLCHTMSLKNPTDSL